MRRLTILIVIATMITLLPAANAGALERHKPAQKAKSPKSKKAAEGPSYAGRAEVAEFATKLSTIEGLDPNWIIKNVSAAQYQPSVAKLIMPVGPGTAKNWMAYRDRFIEPKRIAAGLAFWLNNEAALQRAEQLYGVPPHIVVGIIGVETFYGRVTGNYRVIDALSTLAFDFPKGRSDRSAYFRGELEQYLIWTNREGYDPLSIKGSYAGAIGWPQFMPTSINKFAVDFSGDGHIRLSTDQTDAIGSVAKYLADHGWQRGLKPYYRVAAPVETSSRATLLTPDIKPTFSAADLTRHGALLEDSALSAPGPFAFIELQNGPSAPTFYAGTQNFYVVTRYNWSSYYAMAVIELGEAIAAAKPAH